MFYALPTGASCKFPIWVNRREEEEEEEEGVWRFRGRRYGYGWSYSPSKEGVRWVLVPKDDGGLPSRAELN